MMVILVRKIEVAIKHEANIDYTYNFSALLWNMFDNFFYSWGMLFIFQ